MCFGCVNHPWRTGVLDCLDNMGVLNERATVNFGPVLTVNEDLFKMLMFFHCMSIVHGRLKVWIILTVGVCSTSKQ